MNRDKEPRNRSFKRACAMEKGDLILWQSKTKTVSQVESQYSISNSDAYEAVNT